MHNFREGDYFLPSFSSGACFVCMQTTFEYIRVTQYAVRNARKIDEKRFYNGKWLEQRGKKLELKNCKNTLNAQPVENVHAVFIQFSVFLI